VPEEARSGPGTRIRLVGRALNTLVARAPWLWPAVRAPMRRYFDRAALGWEERTSAGSVEHLQGLAAAVAYVDEKPERILDLGTGTGAGALFLAREYPSASVRGVDVSEEMIRFAQRKVGLDPEGRVAFRVADAADLPFPDQHFDLVASVNVPPFFAEVARVLRAGGYVVAVASGGPATPFFTPDAVLDRGYGRQGVERTASDAIGRATYWVGRKS
jgi:ubiquinone/menaquinone biosynthesis C-methylase UbiE